MAKTLFAISFGTSDGSLSTFGLFQITSRKKAVEICNEIATVFGGRRPFENRRDLPYQCWESSTHYVSMKDYSNVK